MKLLDYNSFINQDRQKTQSINEHLWSGIIHRSETGEEREEDKIHAKEELQEKIQEIIRKTHPKKGDTIDLNHLDVSRVEDMSKLFYDNKKHINFTKYNFDVSDWNVSNVKNMSFMFFGCERFNCDLSRWKVPKVKAMHGMFFRCVSFNSDLSGWDVSNVEDMNAMFSGCKNFNCDLSRWDVSKVTDMNCMFDGCNRLKKIPDWYHDYATFSF